jgi:bacterioferritin (cytochrome b1)
MKRSAKVIEHLNVLLKNELTAINQYFPSFAYVGTYGL